MRACGYVSTRKDGGERLNVTAFCEGSGQRQSADRQGFYAALLDLQPGDEVEIRLGRQQIRLSPVGSSEDNEK